MRREKTNEAILELILLEQKKFIYNSDLIICCDQELYPASQLCADELNEIFSFKKLTRYIYTYVETFKRKPDSFGRFLMIMEKKLGIQYRPVQEIRQIMGTVYQIIFSSRQHQKLMNYFFNLQASIRKLYEINDEFLIETFCLASKIQPQNFFSNTLKLWNIKKKLKLNSVNIQKVSRLFSQQLDDVNKKNQISKQLKNDINLSIINAMNYGKKNNLMTYILNEFQKISFARKILVFCSKTESYSTLKSWIQFMLKTNPVCDSACNAIQHIFTNQPYAIQKIGLCQILCNHSETAFKIAESQFYAPNLEIGYEDNSFEVKRIQSIFYQSRETLKIFHILMNVYKWSEEKYFIKILDCSHYFDLIETRFIDDYELIQEASEMIKLQFSDYDYIKSEASWLP